LTALLSPLAGLPAGAEAHEPPEHRGLRRDGVRLMVSEPGRLPTHARFAQLGDFLSAGDLLVVNTSGTLPASLDAVSEAGEKLRLHLSSELPGRAWLVEPRRPAGHSSRPFDGQLDSQDLRLPGDGAAHLWRHHPGSTRLWLATLELPAPPVEYLARWGSPVRYPYVSAPWPIEDYQTVYATEPGSAEMPSAGRPFSTELITALVARGVGVAPLLLHTGVSSLEGGEDPYPEWFSVPATTADRVNQARAAGQRVVAVGTTVVRALESVAAADRVHGGTGWTDIVVSPERGVSSVDGLITGLHDPQASHLAMLEAIAGRDVLEAAYAAATDEGYLWHEFGDSHLLLRR